MTSKEDIRFEIDQLRKDKIIYAVESVAATLATLLLLNFVVDSKTTFGTISIIATLGYWLFTVYGNTFRLLKIKKLEDKLKENDKK
jgi:hypothetical protein